MERSTPDQHRELTPIEALFLAASVPVAEVGACPVPDCEICHRALPKAA